MSSDTSKIRNFSIIAHIDHGKSTLADRLLELTHTIEDRKMQEQVLDSMDLERERGITIKMQPVRMEHNNYILNLIDTPGHVDFAYEVSRSLAAVQGALLVVDATQGIQAQTIANLHFALEQDLTIIPIINKIDMPAANPDRVELEIKKLLGDDSQIIKISAKTGANVEAVLQAVIDQIPPPKGNTKNDTQILIFDSLYDTYQGVVAHIMVKQGQIKKGDKIYLIDSASETEVLEVGIFKPNRKPTDKLEAGEIGYIITGLKDLKSVQVGDTIINAECRMQNAELKLPGYKKVNPVVFAGLYSKKTEEHEELREALEKINLNDASFSFEPERSDALGSGFRAGFLGLLHLDIIKERISREYNLDVIVTTPSVEYRVKQKNTENTENTENKKTKKQNNTNNLLLVRRPQDLPDQSSIEYIEEPWVKLEIVTPAEHLGSLMTLLQDRRGEYISTEYLDQTRAILHYKIPLNSILTDFYDKLKSVSKGYASLAWEFDSWQENKIVRLDIIIAETQEEALAQLVYEPDAFKMGKAIVEKLKKVLPKQMFVIKIQAAIGGKIIAAERLSAFRKDVTAKLYGGDITRKRKLLEKQKKGKKKMLGQGKVDIPSSVYMEILKK